MEMEKVTLGIIIIIILLLAYVIYVIYQKFFTNQSSAVSNDPTSKFIKYEKMDFAGNDIQCYVEPEDTTSCITKCLNDPNCKSFNTYTWQGKRGCCYKNKTGVLTRDDNVTYYDRK